MTREAFIAANRFGLGPRPGEMAALARDPRAALTAQLDAPAPPSDLPDTAGALDIAETSRAMRAAGRKDLDGDGHPDNPAHELYLREVEARFRRCVATTAPLRERLVLFWSNHFTVSVARGRILPLAGVFEREAIAPHVTGRFEDLLRAAALHPAMLDYLDQTRSFGPDSKIGRRRATGLNENLGREILELHTLGVDGGYDQADVIALAEILTGWSVVEGGGGAPRRFGFDADRHQPGDKRLLGTRIREGGAGETGDAFALLARHPSTARHLATKLVRHFVADDPPAEAVERIAALYLRTGGDLRAVSAGLIGLDAAWRDPFAKVKTPWELVVSMARALAHPGADAEIPLVLQRLRQLGQPPFGAPSPAGWPDRADDWLGPDALLRRIDLAGDVARRVGDRIDLGALIRETIAPVTPAPKLRLIEGAGDLASGIAMVFAAPEFQQR
ncbi:DUF1800 domain-containing protein [Zavarzinia compransoris]|uniref:DUF1800 domain-containing protein n=1 Tax=Zavarzinia marina TaxID=2911065 RepID=UPI001F374C0C|nr:DUF1800 domain-containing protein [Zavarzinia marina]MCF4167265.1 DUF1800 domain-containing protein [Zavarzinia marina]